MLACPELSMLVSDVSLAEFGETAMRRNLEDLDWLDEVARAHHHVIEAAARLFPLLPSRLATVYTSDAAVCTALGERRAALREALLRVAGRVEWGVKAYAAPPPDQPRPPAPRAADEAGAGRAYLKRRRAQLTAGEETRAAALRDARGVHAALSCLSEQARLHSPQAPELSGERLPMLLNGAYLVAENRARSFAAEVEAAAGAHPGLRIELTGPWPPYSFAGEGNDGG
jgi:hypothetical protein